jgi:peroxiredoxin
VVNILITDALRLNLAQNACKAGKILLIAGDGAFSPSCCTEVYDEILDHV